MDAPKCRLCHERHYGSCGVAVAPSPPGVVRDEHEACKPARRKKIEATPVSDAKLSENDTCPTCGTNLAAKRKERERRRKYMKQRRSSQ